MANTQVAPAVASRIPDNAGPIRRAEVISIEGIEDCHRIRSHGTPDSIILDLHAQADGQLTLSESHVLAHHIEDALYKSDSRIADVTVHMEPAGDPVDEL